MGAALKTRISIAIAAFVIPLIFAAATNHVFEDFLITYKSSKNLALGNGLVYHPGERVHTFTSPIGVLVPAALCWVTQDRSDVLVIWLFRVIGAALLSLSAVLLFELMRNQRLKPLAIALGVGVVLTDAKSINFSISGMETSFLVASTILMLYAWLGSPRRPVLLLALAWAGLMWTRPDGFVYAGSFAFAAVVFGVGPRGENIPRLGVIRAMTPALGFAAALYLPWFVWAWSFYGSPVPHTIIAKGLHHDFSLAAVAQKIALFPALSLKSTASFSQCLLPSYAWIGGWPTPLFVVMGQVAWVGSFHWFVPYATPTGRMTSLAACLSHLYLSVLCPGIFPWYLPAATILTVLSLGFLLDAVLRKTKPEDPSGGFKAIVRAHPRASLFTVAMLAASIALLFASARLSAVRQEVIETRHRRAVGEWLSQNADPGDTIFMECLGYLGYYSGLKTYDHPGLSSPEVVAVRRTLAAPLPGKPPFYGAVINALHPDWLILRPYEIEWIVDEDASVLEDDYEFVAGADVSNTIEETRFLPGRPYLHYDEKFALYRRNESPATADGKQ